jgi:hypothetical protein
MVPNGNVNRGLGNGRSWEQLPILLEKSWGKWTTYGGVGYVLNSEPGANNFLYAGAVLEKNVTNNLLLGVEFYTQGRSNIYSPSFKFVNIGGEYSISQKLNIVLGTGRSIAGQQVPYSYLGIHLFL